MKIDNNIIQNLKSAKRVAIFAHKRPDGDCFGSASALKQALIKMGAVCDIYCDCVLPENYAFIKHISDINVSTCEDYDLGVAVDCSDLNRLGKYSSLFSKISTTIKIDHHKTQENFATYNHVELLGSTCEILFFLLTELGIEFDSDIACSLYAGLSSDTGCFMHNSTTSQTHYVASKLMEYDFNFDEANYYLFKRKTIGQIGLLKTALSHLRFLCNNTLAITFLTLRDFEEQNCTNLETFGIVDTCVNIDCAKIGVLISEERPGLYTCSFRSKGKVDVSKICETFGGGGHVNASGCNIFGTYNTVISKIEKAVKDYYARIS